MAKPPEDTDSKDVANIAVALTNSIVKKATKIADEQEASNRKLNVIKSISRSKARPLEEADENSMAAGEEDTEEAEGSPQTDDAEKAADLEAPESPGAVEGADESPAEGQEEGADATKDGPEPGDTSAFSEGSDPNVAEADSAAGDEHLDSDVRDEDALDADAAPEDAGTDSAGTDGATDADESDGQEKPGGGSTDSAAAPAARKSSFGRPKIDGSGGVRPATAGGARPGSAVKARSGGAGAAAGSGGSLAAAPKPVIVVEDDAESGGGSPGADSSGTAESTTESSGAEPAEKDALAVDGENVFAWLRRVSTQMDEMGITEKLKEKYGDATPEVIYDNPKAADGAAATKASQSGSRSVGGEPPFTRQSATQTAVSAAYQPVLPGQPFPAGYDTALPGQPILSGQTVVVPGQTGQPGTDGYDVMDAGRGGYRDGHADLLGVVGDKPAAVAADPRGWNEWGDQEQRHDGEDFDGDREKTRDRRDNRGDRNYKNGREGDREYKKGRDDYDYRDDRRGKERRGGREPRDYKNRRRGGPVEAAAAGWTPCGRCRCCAAMRRALFDADELQEESSVSCLSESEPSVDLDARLGTSPAFSVDDLLDEDVSSMTVSTGTSPSCDDAPPRPRGGKRWLKGVTDDFMRSQGVRQLLLKNDLVEPGRVRSKMTRVVRCPRAAPPAAADSCQQLPQLDAARGDRRRDRRGGRGDDKRCASPPRPCGVRERKPPVSPLTMNTRLIDGSELQCNPTRQFIESYLDRAPCKKGTKRSRRAAKAKRQITISTNLKA